MKQEQLEQIYEKIKSNKGGNVADYIPQLKKLENYGEVSFETEKWLGQVKDGVPHGKGLIQRK